MITTKQPQKEERGWFDPGCTLMYGAMSFRVQCEEDEYIQIYSRKTKSFSFLNQEGMKELH